MISDYLKLAVKNLRKRKVRSWLTMIGIFISIATIFILISLSLGLREAINEQFRMLGTDKFFIMPLGQAGGPGSGGVVELTTRDVDIIKKVNGVKSVTYINMGNGKIEFNKKSRYYIIAGVPLEETDLLETMFESFNLKVDEGKLLEKDDSDVVMIGSQYKYNNLFGKPIKSGDKITINEKRFEVKAVLSSVGNPQDDQNIYMPIDDFSNLFNSGDRADQMIVQIEEGGNLKEIAEKVKKKLTSFRGLDEKTRDFSVLTPEELLASFDVILNIITSFLLGIAAISLIVGGIGIANTMYTSVLERTREIGVMKAIGAKNSDILWIFLIESGLLGFVGGVIGILIGIAVSKSIEYIAVVYFGTDLLRVYFPFYLIFGCVAFSFLVGALSGILPALQASKLKTVDALRYE